MANTVLISVLCPDKPGLIASVTGGLFDLGANLGDAGFAVLGAGAEFTAVCDLPAGVEFDAVDTALRRLPELAGAEISVRAFEMDPDHGPSAEVTHQIVISGGDQPGLVAQICETLGQYRANIVSLNAGRSAHGSVGGSTGTYVIRLAVWLPPESANACLATVSNTAQNMQLACSWTET